MIIANNLNSFSNFFRFPRYRAPGVFIYLAHLGRGKNPLVGLRSGALAASA
jgi:hypothetical protein